MATLFKLIVLLTVGTTVAAQYSPQGDTVAKEGRALRKAIKNDETDRRLTDVDSCGPLDGENVRVVDFDNLDANGRVFWNGRIRDYVLPGPTVVKAQRRYNDGYDDAFLFNVRDDSSEDYSLSHFDFLDNVLIIPEDRGFGPGLDPIPAGSGGKIILTFPTTGVTIRSMRFIDTGGEGEKSEVNLFGGVSRQERIKGFKIPYMQDGEGGVGQKVVPMCTSDVTQIEIDLKGRGAIDDVVITIPPPATEDEVCCDVADLAGRECPPLSEYDQFGGFICCPDGSWACVYADLGYRARCVESGTGVSMSDYGKERSDLIESDLATRAPICGGCDSIDLDTIVSLQLPCPQD